MLLRWIEGLSALVFVLLVITQTVVPLWTGRRLFPLFRKRDAEKRYVAARERVDEVQLEEAAATLERAADGNAPSEEPPEVAMADTAVAATPVKTGAGNSSDRRTRKRA